MFIDTMGEQLLSIGQLAKYVGVTTRAIRHYHTIGLLSEPRRDNSDYRRYDAQDAINLIRIKTLADAGVPLSKIPSVIQASDADLEKIIANIEIDITKRINLLEQSKKQLRKLRSGESLYLQAKIVDYLNQLRCLGISEEVVVLERDGWVLLSVLIPDKIDAIIDLKIALLDDEQFIQLYKQFDQARLWDIGDPRLEKLADQVVTLSMKHSDKSRDKTLESSQAQSVFSIYEENVFPAWKRINDIINLKHRK